MHIQYLWVEEFKNLKNFEINFSNRLFFHFDPETKVLTAEENKEFIQGYFPENITSVTALVGANGVGKTNTIRLLLNWITCDAQIDELKLLIVYKQADDAYIILQKNMECTLPNIEVLPISDNSKVTDSIFYNYEAIYSCTSFDINEISLGTDLSEHYVSLVNASTNGFFQSDVRFHYPDEDSILNTLGFAKCLSINRFANYNRMLHLLLDKRNFFIPQAPEWLIIHVVQSKEPKLLNQAHSYEELRTFLRSKNGGFLLTLFRNIVYAEDAGKDFFDHLIKIFSNQRGSLSLDRFIEEVNNSPILDTSKIEEYNDFQVIFGTLQIVKKIFDLPYDKANHVALYLKNLDDNRVKMLESLLHILGQKPELSKALKLSFSQSNEESTILSTGEQKILQLFSSLYHVKKSTDRELNPTKGENEIIEPKKPITIFIDEIESGLHPQWQKEFLARLIPFISDVFEKNPIQIILTTHSPFILSDLPNYSVKPILGDNNRKIDGQLQLETLGQQIHLLMRDSFFIQNGIVGDYFVHKVGAAVNQIMSDSDLNQEQIKRLQILVNNIADEVLRDRLIELLNRKIPNQNGEGRV